MDVEQLYLHIRVVLGIILGLGITTLLAGIASIIEHPKRFHWSWIHMGWVVWALISIITFWWWEFRLTGVGHWTFATYLFVISYCSLYFMLSTLLFPKDVREYGSYEAYLLHRRGWFFGLIALITVMDQIDTTIKGASQWRALGAAYPIHTVLMLVIAALGVALSGKRAQLLLVLAALAYQLGYFVAEYFTLSAG